jgi:3'(2'), 5'-bisphosphate nucleotidase
MKIYGRENFVVERKSDNSPLTEADRRAHESIAATLGTYLWEETGKPLPLLSEEGKDVPFHERKHWKRFWLVDPLDGTKEFISRNGEFTVNIALIENCRPALGIVYVPVKGVLYYGGPGFGSYKITLNGRDVGEITVHNCPGASGIDALVSESESLP